MDFSSRTEFALASGQWGLALALAAFGGFLTSLSPCVYPLIPITLSVFGARDPTKRGKNFALALVYALGMILLYATLGTAFASAGKVFGTLLAAPGFVVAFAVFSFVMAASMLGAFELALPASVQTRLSMMGGQGYTGAFVMGLVSGLVAAPCTGPVLTVLLTYVAQQHDLTFGFVLMSSFASGLALPFVLLATFSSLITKVPKSGAWMDTVKAVLAAAMVGLGLYYLQFTVPALRQLSRGLVPAVLVACTAVSILIIWAKRSSSAPRLVSSVVLGVAAFVLFGARTAVDTKLTWRSDLEVALAEGKREHKPVMIDFFASWCEACVELDEKTYSQAQVVSALQPFISVKVDGTEESDEITALYARFGVKGLPTVAFISSNGEPLATPRVTGFLGPSEFVSLLQQSATDLTPATP